jgi:hypothetical protein
VPIEDFRLDVHGALLTVCRGVDRWQARKILACPGPSALDTVVKKAQKDQPVLTLTLISSLWWSVMVPNADAALLSFPDLGCQSGAHCPRRVTVPSLFMPYDHMMPYDALHAK